jgi:Flp pilus assembly protein CpaB
VGRRSLIVVLALLLGVVAGGASYAYLHTVQQRAYHNATLTEVYEVKGTIPKGASGAAAVAAGLVVKAKIPTQFRPADTVTDLATIRDEVAVANLTTGEVVSAGLFSTPVVAAGTTAQAIPAGNVAITLSIDAVHSVAGLVQPGDAVDLLVQRGDGSEYVIYQNLRVLAIGSSVAGATQTAAASGSGGASSSLYTFAVPLDAAARLALISTGANGTSNIYLALVPPNTPPSQFRTLLPRDLIPSGPTPQ